MEINIGLPSHLYSTFYVLLVFSLSLITAVGLAQPRNTIIYRPISFPIISILLCAFIIVLLGYRPINYYFGDTPMYAHYYENYANFLRDADFSVEWIWKNLNFFCHQLGLSVNDFFLVIAFLYIGLMAVACYKLFPNNFWISILFIVSSFSFYPFCVNGMRNGLACSILVLAFAFYRKHSLWSILYLCLTFIAFGIHRSTLLPISCFVISIFLPNTKYAIRFWLLSIVLSLVLGNVVGDFFQSLNLFEDKSSYFQDVEGTAASAEFSHVGFRWDFLLYSAMPVIMVWYSTIKRHFEDETYTLLANSYIIANSFWIMVIRASFSNRFAYLSWFLYPIIIAYPLLRFNMSRRQDLYTALILISYSGFTLFMFLK